MRTRGFSLIELLVAITIIGIMATVIIPNIVPEHAGRERQRFIASLNGLLATTWQRALVKGALHRVWVDMQKKQVYVQEQQEGTKDGVPRFAPYKSAYTTSTITWPDSYELKSFFVDGKDELAATGPVNFKVYFVIVPEGLSQEVIINFYDKKDLLENDKKRPVALVLNPFNVQFKEYDTFQK